MDTHILSRQEGHHLLLQEFHSVGGIRQVLGRRFFPDPFDEQCGGGDSYVRGDEQLLQLFPQGLVQA